jgi:OTU domain-containing protein 3
MGKKKDRQRLIEQARAQRKLDKETKMKLRKKMGKGDAFKLSRDYCDYFNAFSKEIAPLRLALRDVGGDGNCLFRAFADQVDGSEAAQAFMREEACSFMARQEEFFRPFLDEEEEGTFENYLKAMRRSGEWGGHLELQALAECFRSVVVVHKRGL